MKKLTLLFLALVIISSCADPEPKPEIKAYLDQAIDTIRTHALKAGEVDWNAVRDSLYAKSVEAESTEDTYEAITYALHKLDDNHSFLQKGGEQLTTPANTHQKEPSPYGTRMKVESGLHEVDGKKIARIFIPQGMKNNAFAQAVQDKIAELQSANPVGWILDVRGNGGGNMWPMVAGVGPLAGYNPLGGSIDGKGMRDFTHYRDGKSIYVDKDGKEQVGAEVEKPIEPISTDIPLAILIDRGTASSGEILATIFKGRPNTRTFGESTFGASTATMGYKLSDSLNLVLAVSTMQDRHGNLYIDGVHPDVEIPIGDEQEDPENDPVIRASIEWILNYNP